ncbi:MAG TPA: biliverdin-producing heme oxygenase [Longimicrobium sp.]
MFPPTRTHSPLPVPDTIRSARPPILDLLRARTSDAHERVENALPLMNPELDGATYARVIARFHAFHAALEPRLAAVPGVDGLGLDLDARRKIPLLERDLRVLGKAATEGAPAIPEVGSVAAALGCMYVLEGSTLGGRVISRHLATLGIDPGSGGAYFSGYGERTGEMWRAFSDVIGSFADENPGSTDEIVAAADATFTLLERWLAR